MNSLHFLLLIVAHFICGFSILSLLKIRLDNIVHKVTLSIMIGLGLASFIPMIMEMMKITIDKQSVAIALILLCLVLLALCFKTIKEDFKQLKEVKLEMKLYDVIILFTMFYLLYVGLYKNYLFPSYPRDYTSGPEVIAKYTIKEGHIVNSVFLQDMSTTNNHQKPPSLLGIQIIYKLFVQEFGQVWLGLLTVCFYLFYYFALRKYTHAIFAGLCLILTIAIPEMYAYIIMVLFDFSNAIFVFLGFYYLYLYLEEFHTKNYLILSSILFGIATFFRSETLILVFLLAGSMILWNYVKNRTFSPKKIIADGLILTLATVVSYVLSIEIFIKKILPTNFDTASNVTKDLFNFSPLFTRLSEMWSVLMYNREPQEGYSSIGLFNETFTLILVFAILELGLVLYFKKSNRKFQFWFSSYALTFFFIGVVGYILPLADLVNTTKRALFKLIPLGFFFIANSSLLAFLSKKIWDWENSVVSENLEPSQEQLYSKKKSKKQK